MAQVASSPAVCAAPARRPAGRRVPGRPPRFRDMSGPEGPAAPQPQRRRQEASVATPLRAMYLLVTPGHGSRRRASGAAAAPVRPGPRAPGRPGARRSVGCRAGPGLACGVRLRLRLRSAARWIDRIWLLLTRERCNARSGRGVGMICNSDERPSRQLPTGRERSNAWPASGVGTPCNNCEHPDRVRAQQRLARERRAHPASAAVSSLGTSQAAGRGNAQGGPDQADAHQQPDHAADQQHVHRNNEQRAHIAGQRRARRAAAAAALSAEQRAHIAEQRRAQRAAATAALLAEQRRARAQSALPVHNLPWQPDFAEAALKHCCAGTRPLAGTT